MDLSMNQYLFLGKEEQIYNTEEEIIKNFTLGEKMCNNEECKCENCTCGSSCKCTAENQCGC